MAPAMLGRMALGPYELVIGTTNPGKARELEELLAPHHFAVRSLRDVGSTLDVVEDGDTFAANARKKASEQAVHLGRWVLADDSGLEVDALGGRPGVFSARYAGQAADDAANNRKLLEELAAVPPPKRSAGYYCHVAVADPTGAIRAETTGICRGRILAEGRGTNGFGYDPLFEIIELHRTFGELGPAVKSALSHRARAMRAIVPLLDRLAASGQWKS